MTGFLASFPIKGCNLAIQGDVVAGSSTMLGGSSEPRPPFRLLMIGNRVGIRANENRMGQRGIPGPAAVLERETETIERAAEVQAFAFPDDMSRTKFDFLASNA